MHQPASRAFNTDFFVLLQNTFIGQTGCCFPWKLLFLSRIRFVPPSVRPSDTKLSPTSIRGGGGGTVRPQHIIFRTQQAKPPLLLLANGKLLPLPPLLCTFPIFLPNPFSCADTPSDQWHGMIAILIGSPSVLRISISLACAYKVAEIVTVVALSSSSGVLRYIIFYRLSVTGNITQIFHYYYFYSSF